MLHDYTPPAHWYHRHLAETDSTMLCLQRPEWTAPGQEFTLVTADYQTAGRGQRGTSWEADRGKNLLFGIRLHPTFVAAHNQFFLSEVQALAVAETLATLTTGISVKWPNDVYVGDKKICGMLLEHTLQGAHVATTITGVGLNVNQTTFAGDAPNPVSLSQVLGHTVDRVALLDAIVQRFEKRYRQLQSGDTAALHTAYKAFLYRREGYHPFRDTLHGVFSAAIVDVAPDGRLTLCTTDGEERTYNFKEVSYVLPASR